ncbi:MAG: DNA-processing protein DprA [Patescibacteria group bacterium]|jgi:DNA processing protein
MLYINQQSRQYPASLLQLTDPPDALYVRGSMKALEKKPSVGVVGSRHMTEYGKRVLETFVPFLAAQGCVIVSGLAFGVDAQAHKLTLESHGTTIAVLGSGIECITPRAHDSLGRNIEKTGAIVSEYPGCIPGGKYTFPARNRIIAALSDILIVVEGTQTSGSLITADFMQQLGKDIFAVPGNIDAPLSAGPNFLIAHGAHPLISVDDLSAKLGFDKHPEHRVLSDVSAEERALLGLLTHAPTSADDLCTQSALPAHVVNAALTTLELKHAVRRTSTGLFSKI